MISDNCRVINKHASCASLRSSSLFMMVSIAQSSHQCLLCKLGRASTTSDMQQNQCIFAGEELVYVAWPHQPINSPGLSGRLGIVYCVNRACALYSMKVTKAANTEVHVPSLPVCKYAIAAATSSCSHELLLGIRSCSCKYMCIQVQPPPRLL